MTQVNKYWPHYPAICRSNDGTYFITNTLYPSEAEAKADIGAIFVRLATEVPPLLLVFNKKG
jgi:hypothetical protein